MDYNQTLLDPEIYYYVQIEQESSDRTVTAVFYTAPDLKWQHDWFFFDSDRTMAQIVAYLEGCVPCDFTIRDTRSNSSYFSG